MGGQWIRHRQVSTPVRPGSLNVLACQTLLAVIVHSAARAKDERFFDGSWFQKICEMMGWNAGWVCQRVADVGVVSEIHFAGYKRDRGRKGATV